MMKESDSPSFENLSPQVERGDHYRYVQSTERRDPALALLARRVHASSYLGEGFIHNEAIDSTGEVASDIDKARGDSVEYYVGVSKQNEAVSTLRKVSIEQGLGIESLPGYQLCGDYLSDEGKTALEAVVAQGRPLKEISSFGHVPEESSLAGLELLRHVLQKSYGTDEVWFFTMVTQKYQTLVNIFGPRAVRKIGDEVALDDSRVGDVSLTPALVDTTTFFDDIKEGIVSEPNAQKRQRLLGSLRNFAKGIDTQRFSDEVVLLLDDENDFNFSTYVQTTAVRQQSEAWTQPMQLDMRNRVDALYSKRLVDDGKVRTVVNPAWHEAFDGEADAGEFDETGSWFYYPWRESLVHFPEEAAYRELRHSRDRHLVTSDEQERLYKTSALFAGLSVGSHVLEHMVYAGVGGAHTLADFDTVSISNLNRLRAGMAQVGEPKVDVFAKRVSELDPYMQLKLLREGVSKQSLDTLALEPSVLFDEVDDFAAKALLRMYAKEHHIPLIMATDVGYKSIIDIERHDIEDVEPFNGRLDQATIEAMLDGTLTEKQRMKIMTKLIGLSNASFRLLQSVSDPTLKGLPQLDVTASQGGALATIAARDILLGRDVPSGRRVHDARKAMKLPAEMPLRDGLVILKNFLAKN